MHEVRIITYNPSYKQHFIDLNTEWLEKYFTVEPHDKNVFDNVEEVILSTGGEIFFCEYNAEIVGTAAMQKMDEKSFELVKMSVTEKHQGKGFSKLLMHRCIQFAKEKKCFFNYYPFQSLSYKCHQFIYKIRI